MHVGKWTERRLLLSPDKAALKEMRTGRVFSYRDIHSRSLRLAAALQNICGVKRGDRMGVLAKNRIEIIDLFFAAAKLGAILVPFNFRLSKEELENILKDSTPKVLFMEEEFGQKLSFIIGAGIVKNVFSFDGDATVFPGGKKYTDLLEGSESGSFAPPIVSPEDPVMILYTGGTTGSPKGALISHRMIFWNAVNTTVSWGLRQQDIAPVFTPLFHTGGWNVFLLPLFHLGGTVLLYDVFDPEQALRVFREEKCTLGFMVPTMFQMLLEQPGFGEDAFPDVRFLISGGAPCPMHLFHSYWEAGLVFKQGYGLTEAGPNCFSLEEADIKRKSPSVGRPVFYSDVRLVDQDGEDVAAGEVGELVIKGPHVCSGYYGNKEATQKAYHQGYFLTGDLARRDEDGFYYIVDRRKDLIISGGENIYPGEIEAVLYRHPAVAEAAVVGVPDVKWGEKVKAVVVLKKDANVSHEDILSFVREYLGGYKIPKLIEYRSEIPKSAAGKILKRELQ